MDDDKRKKKKKNKKKKNQNADRPVEPVTADERELNPGAVSQSADTGQDSDSQVSVNIDADCDGHGHLTNGTDKRPAKTEEKFWLDREALLEARVSQLMKEKDDYHQKEIAQKDEIQQLYDDKNASIAREGILEQTIQQLQREIDAHQQKVNSDKESIASLTIQNTRLQAQVIELENSSDSLVQEKQHLIGIISSLELRIEVLTRSAGTQNSSVDKSLTSEDVDLDQKIEAADALIENMIPESSENAEKVYTEDNVLPVGSVQGTPVENAVRDGDGSVLIHDSAFGAHDTQRSPQVVNTTPEASKMMPFSSSTQSLEDVLLEDDDIKHLSDNNGRKFGNSTEIEEVDDQTVSPVPSNEVEAQKSKNDEEVTDVPLTDAPLIGAPFRFISFVARYVSGADLVDKTGQKPGQEQGKETSGSKG